MSALEALVARLRGPIMLSTDHSDRREAADEIERLSLLVRQKHGELIQSSTYAGERDAALGSLQEMLAKQIVGTEQGAVCAACGQSSKYGEPEHEENCPVDRGLKIISTALSKNTVNGALVERAAEAPSHVDGESRGVEQTGGGHTDPVPTGGAETDGQSPTHSGGNGVRTHRLVPRVPTKEMVDALVDCVMDCADYEQGLMLAISAAPEVPSQGNSA